MSPQTSTLAGWRRFMWLLPFALGTVATALLSWSAWRTARDAAWPPLYHGWWWTALRPDQDWTLILTSALWGLALSCYWWPRRFLNRPIGLITVVSMVIIGGELSTVSFVPCRAGMTASGVLGWLLDLYLGQLPNVFPGGSCPSHAEPLALQLGAIACPGATVIGVLAVGAVLWQEPVRRLRSRFARDATVFTGLGPLTLPLLRQLAAGTRNPRQIIVIEPDERHPMIEDARMTGARVVIGDPSSAQLLGPIISTWRGCALNHLYALGPKVSENDTIVETAAHILGRCQPTPNRRPHLVALIDDPRQAVSWRSSHSVSPGAWFEDALSSAESTARSLVTRVLRTQPRHLLICGDSTLTLAILLELARRAWEQAELVKAAELGQTARLAGSPHPLPVPLTLERIGLIDFRAADIRREYLASAPRAILSSLPDVVAQPVQWRGHLLRTLDAMDLSLARETTVIIADSPPDSGMHEAGRVARLHQETPVFVLASSNDGKNEAIFDLLHTFEHSLLVADEVPEDSWTRIARHWHECYRLKNPVPPGHQKEAARLPWPELSPFLQQDTILELRSILSAVAALGRQWAPVHMVPHGSIVELSERELGQVAETEHNRWLRHRLAPGGPARDARKASQEESANEYLVPWSQLPQPLRDGVCAHLRSQLAQLEDVGFVPVIPVGGPPDAEHFERVGIVEGSQLTKPMTWTNHHGATLHGYPGDWHVVDSAGHVRTVSDPDFRVSHAPVGDGTWRRIGIYHAWRVDETVFIRTKEGRVAALPGDWVVESPRGERWPIRDEQFQWSYRPVPEAPAEPDRERQASPTGDQQSATAAQSSSTAPAISS